MKGREQTTPPPAPTGSFQNAADQAVLAQIAAAEAAGHDPFGDDDDDTAAPPPAPAKAEDTVEPPSFDDEHDELDEPPAPAKTAAAQATEDPPKTQQENPGDETPAPAPAPAPKAPTYQTKSLSELTQASTDLIAKKAKAFAEYSDGTMSPEDYAKLDGEVMQGLMAIASEQALVQANQQHAIQTSQQALDSVKAIAAAQGLVDYATDQTAMVQFDAMAEALAKDPKMAALDDAAFFLKTHNMVLALRGHAAPAPAPMPAPTTKAKPREDMKPPLSLRDVPTAAVANTGGGVSEQLSRLQGMEFQHAIGKMNPAQLDAWLDS